MPDELNGKTTTVRCPNCGNIIGKLALELDVISGTCTTCGYGFSITITATSEVIINPDTSELPARIIEVHDPMEL